MTMLVHTAASSSSSLDSIALVVFRWLYYNQDTWLLKGLRGLLQ